MKRYKIVGWYSTDGSNEHTLPIARVVVVEANDEEEAYEKGGIALDKLYEERGASLDFLNWFIKEVA